MPLRRLNFQSEEERREYKRDYQREYRQRRKEQMHDSENGSQHFVHNEDETTIFARKRTKMMDCEIKKSRVQGNTNNSDILSCFDKYTPIQFVNELQFSNRSLNLHSLENEMDNRF